MKISITLFNKTSHTTPALSIIKKTIFDILKEKNMSGNFEISINVVTKEEIQKLNLKYRKKDTPTDVLSFPIFTKPPKDSEKIIPLGDIVICPEMIDVNDNFLNLIKHSMLHLLGYHHK